MRGNVAGNLFVNNVGFYRLSVMAHEKQRRRQGSKSETTGF